MKTPSRALLLALLAAVAALAAMTLSAGAQTPGGGSESDSTETVQGRIIARVQDTTGEDGVDDYRVEFGFFPEWAMTEAASWSDAIAPKSSWLPSSRFLTKSAIDARVAADNRAWLRSSLISVPAQSAQSPGGDSVQITGRVIARYNPDSEGGLRVEFGFVPEWAFTDTSTTEQAVERLGASNLPSARYLRVATIDASRGVWLRSSAIDVPFRAPVVVIETVQAPVIDSISCAPSSPTVDESVTCTTTLSGDTPDSYAWSGGASTGSEATYSTSFSTSGSKTISLTATNTAGSDTGSTTLTVAQPLQPPVVDSISCTPSSPATADEDVTCTASLSGGAPDSWAWSGGVSGGRRAAYSPSFDGDGEYTVSLTVANTAGSDTDSTTVTVGDGTMTALLPPEIDSLSCSPSSPTVDEDVTCTATVSGDEPVSYEWRAGSSNGDGQSHSTSFSKAGDYTVSLSVTNSAGSDTDSITLTVFDEMQPPAIDGINCSPSSPMIDEDVTCTPSLSGGAPDTYAWSGGGDGEIHSTSFSKVGDYTVSLTVTNSAGSDTTSITLVVQELQAPVIDEIYCQRPPEPGYENSPQVFCTAGLSGGAPDSYTWSGGIADGTEESYLINNRATYFAFVDPMGDLTISLTVTNSAGSDSASAAVEVDAEAMVNDSKPLIDRINCFPSSPAVNEQVTCTANLNSFGGEANSYDWRVAGATGSGDSYSTSFSKAGDYAVSLTVTNAVGSDTESITLTVFDSVQPPVIDGISCSPSSPVVDEDVTCTPSLSGGAPDSYAWRVASASGDGDSYSTSFGKAGDYTVSLTVTNAAGSNSSSVGLTVTEPEPLTINSITCDPSSPAVGENVACTASVTGGGYWMITHSWSGGTSDSDDDIYVTSFESEGDATVSLTVENVSSGGSDSATKSTTLTVAALPAPVVDSITCTPSDPPVGDPVKCTASLSGGAPSSYAWSGGRTASAAAIYNTDFGEAGAATVSLTVTNAAGSGRGTTTVTANGYPQCSWNGGRKFSVGESWSGDAEAFGAGIVTCTDADTLTYTLSSSDSAILAVSESDGAWTVDALTAGTTYVHITVTDPGDLSYTVGLSVIVVAAPVQAPVIDSVSCTPSPSMVGESVTCTATLSGGDPDSYSWSGGASSGSSSTYDTSFGSSGSKTVSLTVTNSAGSDTMSTTLSVVSVEASPQALTIDSIDCTPFSPTVGEDMTCTANVSGGVPHSYWWSGGASTSTSATYTTSFSSAGLQTVTLIVDSAADRAIEEFLFYVEEQ